MLSDRHPSLTLCVQSLTPAELLTRLCTHSWSFFLQEIVQEQITRVLLERLIVNRPHPWGLLITFIELIKNPRCVSDRSRTVVHQHNMLPRAVPQFETRVLCVAQLLGVVKGVKAVL